MGFDPKRYEYNFKAAAEQIAKIEAGEIVNATAVISESENRPVDHYNLRSRQEKVSGKSLTKSLEMWQQVQQFASKHIKGFKHVIFNGIGGSFLGPYMLVQSILGDEYNTVQTKNGRPTLHFVANTDSDSFAQLFNLLNVEETMMVVISKSGSTAETATNTKCFMSLCESHKLDAAKHMCAITVAGSALDKMAAPWLARFNMFESTGGRTSICSAVAAVPMAFAGLDFGAFLTGMADMDEATRLPDYHQNPAFQIAAMIDEFLVKAAAPRNMIILGYSDALKHYYHYCQQLYMESLGKAYSRDGCVNPRGLTVYGGIGTGEQHAFMQQIQKGVLDSFVKFIQFQKRRFPDQKDEKAGTMGRQLLAFLKGTELALQQNNRQFMTLTVKECSEHTIGQLIALEERIVTVLACFWNVNAYDQPGVQDGKLAANRVNKLSLAIDSKLVACENCTTEQILKKIDINEDAWLSESIISDICANPTSYNTKLAGTKHWKDDKFVFSFK